MATLTISPEEFGIVGKRSTEDDMGNLTDYAKSELKRSGMDVDGPADDMNTMMAKNIVELVETFGNQGHSGFSAPYAVGCLEKLLRFEPLSPLTGEDDEWTEVSDGVFQNKRCSSVFRQADRFGGQPYNIDGKVFVEPDGVAFTSSDSFVPVTFPYVPKREYVQVEARRD